MKVRKFVNRFPEILKGKEFDISRLKDIFPQIGEIKPMMVITYKEDIMQYVMTSLLIKYGKYDRVSIFNAYSLLDIYLGNNEDYKTVLDITSNVVIIYLGYSEFENRRQSDIIEQVIEQQRVRGRVCWLLYKGATFNQDYPKIASLVGSNRGIITEIKSAAASSYEEEL